MAVSSQSTQLRTPLPFSLPSESSGLSAPEDFSSVPLPLWSSLLVYKKRRPQGVFDIAIEWK